MLNRRKSKLKKKTKEGEDENDAGGAKKKIRVKKSQLYLNERVINLQFRGKEERKRILRSKVRL